MNNFDIIKLISKILKNEKYDSIEKEYRPPNSKNERHMVADIATTSSNGEQTLCEIKTYASDRIPIAFIIKAITKLNEMILKFGAEKGIFITTTNIQSSDMVKLTYPNIEVWDRKIIYQKLQNHPDLILEFEDILKETQVFGNNVFSHEYNEDTQNNKDTQQNFSIRGESSSNKGATICQNLQKLNSGRADASEYEVECENALKHLFSVYLSGWRTQPPANEGLHRFDLIARIKPGNNDFWIMLVNLHRTRYIVFEFKNYTSEIGQNEIYGTEKYLYPKAMRSVAILVARHGAKKNAYAAARGALRESGKVIIILTMNDICEMLHDSDSGGDPSDKLTVILDDMLMDIGR